MYFTKLLFLFQLENSNKLSDILAREKLEIERKEASEKYEREIIRSQDLAQNVSITKWWAKNGEKNYLKDFFLTIISTKIDYKI